MATAFLPSPGATEQPTAPTSETPLETVGALMRDPEFSALPYIERVAKFVQRSNKDPEFRKLSDADKQGIASIVLRHGETQGEMTVRPQVGGDVATPPQQGILAAPAEAGPSGSPDLLARGAALLRALPRDIAEAAEPVRERYIIPDESPPVRERYIIPDEPEPDAVPTGTPPRDYIGSATRILGGGGIQGTATGLGLPADLLNTIGQGTKWVAETGMGVPHDLWTLPQIPGGREDWMGLARTVLTKLDIDPKSILEPQGGLERFAQGVIREAVGAALPVGVVGGMVKLANMSVNGWPALEAFLHSGAPEAKRLINLLPENPSVLETLAAVPYGTLVGIQAKYGALQGIGSELAGAMTASPEQPGGSEIARVIGGLIGATGPALFQQSAKLVSAIAQAARRARNNPAQVEQDLMQGIAVALQRDPRALPNLREAEQVAQQFPDMPITLGQASNNPDLLTTEARLTHKVPGLSADVAMARQAVGRETGAAAEAGIARVAGEGQLGAVQEEAARQQQGLFASQEAARQAEEAAAARALEREAARVAVRQARAKSLAAEAKRLRDAMRTSLVEEATGTVEAANARQAFVLQHAERERALQNTAIADAESKAAELAARLRGAGVSNGDIQQRAGSIVLAARRQALNEATQSSARLYRQVNPGTPLLETIQSAELDALGRPVRDLHRDLVEIRQFARDNNLPVPPQATGTIRALESRAQRIASGQPPPMLAFGSAAESQVMPKDLELQRFIYRMGGIRRDAAFPSEAEALLSPKEIGRRGQTPLLHKNGLSLQEMAEQAQEAGFLHTADTSELLDALRESIGGRPVYSRSNSRIDAILGEMLGETPSAGPSIALSAATELPFDQTPLTFMEAHGLRSRLLQAERETRDRRVRALAQNAREHLDHLMQIMVENAGTPEVMERYRTAQNYWKEHVLPFASGAMGRVGGPVSPALETVVSRFWHTRPGHVTDLQQFHRLLGDYPQAVEAVRDVARNELYLAAVKETPEGLLRFDAGKAQAWAKAHEAQLALMPELRDEFTTLMGQQRQIEIVKERARALDALLAQDITDATEEVTQATKQAEQVFKSTEPGTKPITLSPTTPSNDPRLAGQQAQQRLAPLVGQVEMTEKVAQHAQREGPAAIAQMRKINAQQMAELLAAQQAEQRAFSQRPLAQMLGPDYQEKLRHMMGLKGTMRQRAVLGLAEDVLATGNPEVREGLLHGLWDAYLQNLPKNTEYVANSRIPLHNPEALQQFVTDFAPAIRRLGGEEFVTDLTQIARALRIALRHNTAGTDLYPAMNEIGRGAAALRILAGKTASLTAGAITGTLGNAALSGATGGAVALPSNVAPLVGAALWYTMGAPFREWALHGGEARIHLVQQLLQDKLFHPDIAHTIALLQRGNAPVGDVLPRLYIHLLNLGKTTDGPVPAPILPTDSTIPARERGAPQ